MPRITVLSSVLAVALCVRAEAPPGLWVSPGLAPAALPARHNGPVVVDNDGCQLTEAEQLADDDRHDLWAMHQSGTCQRIRHLLRGESSWRDDEAANGERIAQELASARTCAVVGASGAKLPSYGTLIDQHDAVIRMNGERHTNTPLVAAS